MGHWARVVWAAGVLALAPALRAQSVPVPATQPASSALWLPAAAEVAPLRLIDEPASVYPPKDVPQEQEGINQGGVNFDFDFSYITTYVYRGIDQSTIGSHREHALQFDGKTEFNLGKLPHPFIGLFSNVFNSDPVSRFEEVRPSMGLEWTLKPLVITGGYTAYIFPNRKNLDTQEIFASVALDDSLLFHTVHPVFFPYVYGAYDLDLYDGFYVEAGLRHDFIFQDIGLTLTPKADVAYVIHNPYFVQAGSTKETGFQHYDIGLEGTYLLNNLLHLSSRYGQWSIKGYLYYTDGIDNHLRADTLIWGGAGLSFRY